MKRRRFLASILALFGFSRTGNASHGTSLDIDRLAEAAYELMVIRCASFTYDVAGWPRWKDFNPKWKGVWLVVVAEIGKYVAADPDNLDHVPRLAYELYFTTYDTFDDNPLPHPTWEAGLDAYGKDSWRNIVALVKRKMGRSKDR
jgi:hypothetical protein